MDRQSLIDRLVDALDAAQYALNSVPRTRLNGKHKDTYEVAEIVDAALFDGRSARSEILPSPQQKIDPLPPPNPKQKASSLTKADMRLADVEVYMGSDGPGFNCSLFVRGARLVHAIADGGGGEPRYTWYNLKGEPDYKMDVNKDARILELRSFLSQLPPVDFNEVKIAYSLDMFLGAMVDEQTINPRHARSVSEAAPLPVAPSKGKSASRKSR